MTKLDLRRWFIEYLFFRFEVSRNSVNEEILVFHTYKLQELIPILSQSAIIEFSVNKATEPYTVYVYPENDKFIVSASTRNGSHVMHFNFNGDRL